MKKKSYQCPFEPNQLVVYNKHSGLFKEGEVFLFLGEVKQMPGHCIIVGKDGKVHFGWHTDSFREPTEDEI